MHCYIVDTQSDVRYNPKIAGTTHNVFGIQTGVAVMFLIKSDKKKEDCKIEYYKLDEDWRKEEKWQWFNNNRIENIEFEKIIPDKNNSWVNLVENDFETLIPLVTKSNNITPKSIFKQYTIGSNTARDEWVYDFNLTELNKKINYFIETYNKKLVLKASYNNDTSIKWTRGLKQKFDKRIKLIFDGDSIVNCFYRPFVMKKLFHSISLVEMPSLLPKLTVGENLFITFSGSSHSKPFQAYSTNNIFSFDFLEKTTGLPLFYFDKNENKINNITDWGLEQFANQYNDNKITKEDIFNYTYAVLHNPAYRKKYELNLKREFPRLPFYTDFWKWAAWGKQLMDLHINYETAKPFDLKENTYEVKATAKKQKEIFTKAEEPEPMFGKKAKIKPKLKADKQEGLIEIDELTFLTGVPKEAWDYKLGNRSALEWVLDQYKEKKPSDPTIAEKFNTYQFADYKVHVIDLLRKVCRVSVETVRIVGEMGKEG